MSEEHEQDPSHSATAHHAPGQPIPFRYFDDRRLLLYIEHSDAVDASALASSVARSTKLDELSAERILEVNFKHIITFPTAEAGKKLSVVPAGLRPGTAVGELVRAIFDAPDPKPVDIRAPDDAHGLNLVAVSPSWFMPAAPHGIGTGGPGHEPDRVTEPPGQDAWNFHFQSSAGVDAIEHAGENVHVLILDTFRSESLLDKALRHKHKSHPLLIRLMAPGRLRFLPASPADLQLPAHTGAAKMRYRMADHGLFAAGIINTIADEATLHLVEVLNGNGVGSFESIAEGLLYALNVREANPQARIIVNCSFMLSAPEPRPEGEALAEAEAQAIVRHPRSEYPAELDHPDVFTYMNKPFEDIITALTKRGIILVAAAGNDAQQPGEPRPPARYPAAFDNVISVGALPMSGVRAVWEHASYSNMASRNGKEGYLTLGGEPGGAAKGVLGIYLDDLPNGHKANLANLAEAEDGHNYIANETGWAWWAGTSFATPIVTGWLAAMGPSAATAASLASVQAHEAALKTRTGLTTGTKPAMHNVLHVTQGP